ncbi:MAG: hypothetical protein HC802_01605 [Caldilineaceae bacterium]|nr:hypothetical protein [Caldilineaceae bacterium]
MSIIDSLSAGYRFLIRHLYLVLLPVALDLVLWLSPRLTIASTMERVVDFYTQMAALDELPEEMAAMMSQTATMMEGLGKSVNLLGFLVNSSLLHVPSLMVMLEPTPTATLLDISGWWRVLGLSILFAAIGILLGVAYMSLLARVLPLGSAPKPSGWGEFVRLVIRHWLRLLLFVGLTIAIFAMCMLPVGLGVSLLSMLIPVAGGLLMVMVGGFVLVIFFYLFFVVPAIIVDDLSIAAAISQSVLLVRNNFLPTIGFMFLSGLIAGGIGLILSPVAEYGPVGLLVAIAVNAFVGSGLAMALLVFYRTRLLRMTGGEELLAA